MLSDVQAIYDETRMRSESLAQLVFQRVRTLLTRPGPTSAYILLLFILYCS